ncbi:MAG TPA: SOS response-associated peptidase family protein [Steroidobacteraceae bacterium]|nr:SOS response-associated peptidase family protein [Steroidobacteraceae bacterium]
MTQRLVIPGREAVDRELPVTHPWWRFAPRFNVAVSQSVPVARMHERESEGVMMRWGMIAKSAAGDISFSNRARVRSDTLHAIEDLREPWLAGQRGIVPLAGFYLWQRASAGHLQPYYVRLRDRPVFGVAAVWDRVESEEDDVYESCALISVVANPLVGDLGRTGRMLGILESESYETWLSGTVAEAAALLQTYPQDAMVGYPVAPYVNTLEYDEPALIKPVTG